MKRITLLSLLAIPAIGFGQFTTPNTGTSYTLSDLVDISGGAITMNADDYIANDDFTIAESDTLLILEDATLRLDSAVRVTVSGRLEINSNSLFTKLGEYDFDGFRFESESSVHLEGSTFEYGGGLRALTGDFSLIDCTVQYQSTGVSTSGALGLSTGKPQITGNTFFANESAAIGSGANGAVAPFIDNNIFDGNTTANQNRPQINLGPSGTDTTFITNNTVTGNPDYEMAGGIAISSLLGGESHGVISGNTVTNNRYGIAAIGNNNYTLISDNVIENNNTQDNPDLGGSGININASTENGHIILNNIIRGNLWGITVQGNGMINMGDYQDENIGEGNNTFANNENGGIVHALFNNTPNPVKAQGNCWIEGAESTAEEVAAVISDMSDDASLGEVDYANFLCAAPNGIADIELSKVANIFPNPTTATVNIELKKAANKITLMDLSGRIISNQSGDFNAVQTLDLSELASGFYIIQISGKDYLSAGKIAKK